MLELDGDPGKNVVGCGFVCVCDGPRKVRATAFCSVATLSGACFKVRNVVQTPVSRVQRKQSQAIGGPQYATFRENQRRCSAVRKAGKGEGQDQIPSSVCVCSKIACSGRHDVSETAKDTVMKV